MTISRPSGFLNRSSLSLNPSFIIPLRLSRAVHGSCWCHVRSKGRERHAREHRSRRLDGRVDVRGAGVLEEPELAIEQIRRGEAEEPRPAGEAPAQARVHDPEVFVAVREGWVKAEPAH